MSETKKPDIAQRERFVERESAYPEPTGVIYDRENGKAWLESTVYIPADEWE